VLSQEANEVFESYALRATPSAVWIDPEGVIAGAPAEGVPAIEALVRTSPSFVGSWTSNTQQHSEQGAAAGSRAWAQLARPSRGPAASSRSGAARRASSGAVPATQTPANPQTLQ
jgi:hypothetical protein